MNFIKNQKGITLSYLIITIIILGILSTIAITSFNNSDDVGKYNKMIADITLLRDKILVYYNKNGEIPVIDNTSETIEGVTYNKIDVTKLRNITLNNGYSNEEGDYYLVNNDLEVYYKKGTQKSGRTYHTDK